MNQGDPLTEKIIACCFKVHSELGSGFNEKIYHKALKLALGEAGLKYRQKRNSQFFFKIRKEAPLG